MIPALTRALWRCKIYSTLDGASALASAYSCAALSHCLLTSYLRPCLKCFFPSAANMAVGMAISRTMVMATAGRNRYIFFITSFPYLSIADRKVVALAQACEAQSY